jgi:hypothetical protein
MKANDRPAPPPIPPTAGPPPLRSGPGGGPPGFPEDDWRDRTPPPSGALTFLAVMNLVYALCCGCMGGLYWFTLVTATDESLSNDPEVRLEMERQVDNAVSQQRPWQGNTDLSPEDQKRLQKATVLAVLAAQPAIRTSEAVGRLRDASAVGLCAQVATFFGAILLLMRKKAGRSVSIVACVAYVLSCALTTVAAERAGTDVGAAVADAMRDPEAVKDLTDAERTMISTRLADGIGPAAGAAAVFSVMTALWPIGALLMLLFSRGIRDAVDPPQVDEFR